MDRLPRNKPRRLSPKDEAALRSGPMAAYGVKVNREAAFLTGIMIPSTGIAIDKVARARLHKAAAATVSAGHPCLLVFAKNQTRRRIDRP